MKLYTGSLGLLWDRVIRAVFMFLSMLLFLINGLFVEVCTLGCKVGRVGLVFILLILLINLIFRTIYLPITYTLLLYIDLFRITHYGISVNSVYIVLFYHRFQSSSQPYTKDNYYLSQPYTHCWQIS